MEYRREIDGLRAVAVLPVILFHAGFEAFSGGFIGVDVFFVISGYLITANIITELERGTFSIGNFYERRARRLLPAMFLVMFACIPFAWFLLLPSDMKEFAQSLIAALVFTSNVFFWRESGYFATASELTPLLHTWSLAVEEQYYVLFPPLLLLVWKFGKRKTLLFLAAMLCTSFSLAQWGSLAKPAATFFLLPTRGWELLLGGIASFHLPRSSRSRLDHGLGEVGGWLGLALISISVFIYSKATPFPGVYALVPAVGTVLVILFAARDTTAGKVLGHTAFVGVGLISYSAYLWHQPLFAFARHGNINEPTARVYALLSVLTFILAYFSWRFLEVPFRNRVTTSRMKLVSVSVVCSAILLSVGLSGQISDGFGVRFGERHLQMDKAQLDKNPRQAECHFSAESFPAPEEYCLLGAGEVVGMLLGDSHANVLAYPLSVALGRHNVSFLSATYSGCPPVPNLYRVDQKNDHKCYDINRQSFDYALRNPNIENVVLVGHWTAYYQGDTFQNGEGGATSGGYPSLDLVSEDGEKLRHGEERRKNLVLEQYLKAVTRLLDAGKTVYLIYPIPEVGFDVPRYYAKAELLGRARHETTTGYDVFVRRNQPVIRAFDSLGTRRGLVRIRPDVMLCDTIVAARCVIEMDGHLLYYDDNHLTNTGSKPLAEEIVRHLRMRVGRPGLVPGKLP